MQRYEASAGGAVIYWSLGETKRTQFVEGLERLGLKRFSPKERTQTSALRAACKEYSCDMDRMIVPHKRQNSNGVEVVKIERGEQRNHYTADFSAKVVDNEVQVRNGYADRSRLQHLYESYQKLLPASAVTHSLVDILKSWDGTCLRDAGGVYWLPDSLVSNWQQVAQLTEDSSLERGKSRVYLLRTRMDEQAMRAVRDAVSAESLAAIDSIEREITAGMGPKALEARARQCAAIRERLGAYQEFLGDALSALERAARSVEETATLAAMASMGEGD